jgi:hypothetical protein
MMDAKTVLAFYKRPEIQQAIVQSARDREVAVKFGDRGFGKRPDILRYPGDVGELAAQGATSFHVSEERWSNPLQIVTGMSREQADALRSGWDLIIDIDCPELEYSKQTAYLIIEWLKHHDIRSISCKFSGNKGFHIGVPFEAFPQRIADKETRHLFPEAPRRVAMFIQEKIKDHLARRIIDLEGGNFDEIARKAGFDSKSEILSAKDGIKTVNVEAFLEIDTVLISSRHLYRSVYSFNEKSGLVSLPIDIDKVLEFQKPMADPKTLTIPSQRFLDTSRSTSSECFGLFTEAFDFQPELPVEEEEKKEFKDFEIPEDAIPEECFPPCMQLILKGLKDGKKRALFSLINFLKSVGWEHDAIEARLREWNKVNPEALRENILIGQIRYSKNRKAMLPANCANSIYKDIHVCEPDNVCKYIKNPVNYAKKKGKNPNASAQSLPKPKKTSSQ